MFRDIANVSFNVSFWYRQRLARSWNSGGRQNLAWQMLCIHQKVSKRKSDTTLPKWFTQDSPQQLESVDYQSVVCLSSNFNPLGWPHLSLSNAGPWRKVIGLHHPMIRDFLWMLFTRCHMKEEMIEASPFSSCKKRWQCTHSEKLKMYQNGNSQGVAD